ncbi:unnamed protein product [Jaminaea pallidilutea]
MAAATAKASPQASTSNTTLDADLLRPHLLFTHSSQYNHYLNAPASSSKAPLASYRPALAIDDPDNGGDASKSLFLLVDYYLLRLPLLAKAFGLPERVLGTSMTYLKRFFADAAGARDAAEPFKNAADDQEAAGQGGLRGAKGVKVVMLICLFLATKTHSTPIDLRAFASRVTSSPPGSSKEGHETAVQETVVSIRENEFEVASVLKWRFRVTHGFEATRGIALDLQTLEQRALDVATLKAVLDDLNEASHHLRLTDAEFRYTPTQLGLGTWWSLTRLHSTRQRSEEQRSGLRATLEAWIDEKEAIAKRSLEERRAALIEATNAAAGKEKKTSNTTTTGMELPEATGPALGISKADLIRKAEEVADLVTRGSELERQLKSKEALDRIRRIDSSLKEWAVKRQQQQLLTMLDADAAAGGRGAGASVQGMPAAAGASKRKADADDQGGGGSDAVGLAEKRPRVKTEQVDSDDE